jgi:hypothetical protein
MTLGPGLKVVADAWTTNGDSHAVIREQVYSSMRMFGLEAKDTERRGWNQNSKAVLVHKVMMEETV